MDIIDVTLFASVGMQSVVDGSREPRGKRGITWCSGQLSPDGYLKPMSPGFDGFASFMCFFRAGKRKLLLDPDLGSCKRVAHLVEQAA